LIGPLKYTSDQHKILTIKFFIADNGIDGPNVTFCNITGEKVTSI